MNSKAMMCAALLLCSTPALAEKERETWRYKTDAGIQHSDVEVEFYLWPEYECDVDAYEMPNYDLAAAKIVARDNETGESIETDACWLEKDGVILVFDEHRRQFKHRQYQYDRVQ